MTNILFVAFLALVFATLLRFAFRALPEERWQILAAVPARRGATAGSWQGVNLTYYGAFVATGSTLAAALYLLLTSAAGLPPAMSLGALVALFGLCLPAAKLLARRVERKKHTFTVAGAAFTGLFIAPGALWLAAAASGHHDDATTLLLPGMAAICVAYAVGEGVGRLACISFGCCYGKPLGDLSPRLRRLFARLSFTFRGELKKIAYASRLEGVQVVPIQGLSAVVLSLLGLLGTLLFLESHYTAALALTLIGSQAWRLLSEPLRADHRGGGHLSTYQVMCLLAILGALGLLALLPATPAHADLAAGLGSLWHPARLLGLQLLWCAIFLFTGTSMVTGSELTFHLRHDRV